MADFSAIRPPTGAHNVDAWPLITAALRGANDPDDVDRLLAPRYVEMVRSTHFSALTKRLRRCDLWASACVRSAELDLTRDEEIAVLTLWGEWRATGGWSRRYNRALHVATAEVFDFAPPFDLTRGMGKTAARIVSENRTAWHSIIRSVYDRTQALLTGSIVVGYRGIRTDRAPSAEPHDPGLRPLSSFSLDQTTGRTFPLSGSGSHHILQRAAIPAERVWATPASGFASLGEKELIVIGTNDRSDRVDELLLN